MDTYIGAGSSLGDRRYSLIAALSALGRLGLPPVRVSSLWETESVDSPRASSFLNLVLQVDTGWEPERVLDGLLHIEKALGRRRGARNAPRRLDLDLLVQGSLRRESSRLTLPHPRMWRRRFVLAPLAEIAPGLLDPGSGRTVADLLGELPPRPWARRVGVLPALPGSSYNPAPGYL